MNGRTDIVIIGGGLNGLVAAHELARAGRRPLVLERRETIGGTCSTGPLAPGFRAPTLLHATGPLRPDLLAGMGLARHGLEMLNSETRVFSTSSDGRALVLSGDAGRSVESIAAFSRADADRYPAFAETVGRLAGVLGNLVDMTPPDIDHPGAGDILALLRTGKRVRDLGKRDLYRLLRWMPMAVADVAAEWFDTEVLRAAVAARAVLGQAAGPWSAGTGAVYFLRAAADPHAMGSVVVPRGGPGALADAVAAAARAAGATIRTGAEVARIEVENGVATGLTLASGERLDVPFIVSGLDPKRTLLGLVEPSHIGPDMRHRLANIRTRGVTAKVNLALGALPSFTALMDRGAEAKRALTGRILVAPEIDYVERAFDASKYGRIPEHPFLEATLPTLLDPTLAPEGRHVMSVLVQFTPHRLHEGDWNGRREALGDLVVKTLAEHAPDLPRLVEHRQVITPDDLEREWGLTGGHIFQGEEALDQIFTMRPLLGYARYRTMIRGLYLCGAGTHPGGGLTGANGRNAARAVLADRK
jgi:phytoene dehydrogenase-like protein